MINRHYFSVRDSEELAALRITYHLPWEWVFLNYHTSFSVNDGEGAWAEFSLTQDRLATEDNKFIFVNGYHARISLSLQLFLLKVDLFPDKASCACNKPLNRAELFKRGVPPTHDEEHRVKTVTWMARTTDEHVRKFSPNISNRVIPFHFINHLLVCTTTDEEESVICTHRMLKMWKIHESFLHFVHDFILFVVYYWI